MLPVKWHDCIVYVKHRKVYLHVQCSIKSYITIVFGVFQTPENQKLIQETMLTGIWRYCTNTGTFT